jgi:hypothetical protein
MVTKCHSDSSALGLKTRSAVLAGQRSKLEGIRRGLKSMKRNAGKPADKFFREFFAGNGIPEHDKTIRQSMLSRMRLIKRPYLCSSARSFNERE